LFVSFLNAASMSLLQWLIRTENLFPGKSLQASMTQDIFFLCSSALLSNTTQLPFINTHKKRQLSIQLGWKQHFNFSWAVATLLVGFSGWCPTPTASSTACKRRQEPEPQIPAAIALTGLGVPLYHEKRHTFWGACKKPAVLPCCNRLNPLVARSFTHLAFLLRCSNTRCTLFLSKTEPLPNAWLYFPPSLPAFPH